MTTMPVLRAQARTPAVDGSGSGASGGGPDRGGPDPPLSHGAMEAAAEVGAAPQRFNRSSGEDRQSTVPAGRTHSQR